MNIGKTITALRTLKKIAGSLNTTVGYLLGNETASNARVMELIGAGWELLRNIDDCTPSNRELPDTSRFENALYALQRTNHHDT